MNIFAIHAVSFCLMLLVPQRAGLVAIHAHHTSFTTDPIGNVYLLRGPELVKYDISGKKMARYSNLRLGDIATADATNPLKILLYYSDFQQLVFLDNQLSPNGKAISLEQLGLEQVSLVCASVNNGFWIYDKRNNELHRFNEGQRKIASTGNLRQVLAADMSPVSMKEHNNYLYLNCPETGIYVFDIFGAFSRLIPVKGATNVQVTGELIYTAKAGRLCSFDQRRLEEVCDTLSGPPVHSAMVANGRRYFSYGDSILVRPL